jgi:hypothetical protein
MRSISSVSGQVLGAGNEGSTTGSPAIARQHTPHAPLSPRESPEVPAPSWGEVASAR